MEIFYLSFPYLLLILSPFLCFYYLYVGTSKSHIFLIFCLSLFFSLLQIDTISIDLSICFLILCFFLFCWFILANWVLVVISILIIMLNSRMQNIHSLYFITYTFLLIWFIIMRYCHYATPMLKHDILWKFTMAILKSSSAKFKLWTPHEQLLLYSLQ